MDAIIVDLTPIRSLQYPVQEEDVLFVISSIVEENNDLPARVVAEQTILASMGAGGIYVGGQGQDLGHLPMSNPSIHFVRNRALEDYNQVVDRVLYVSGTQGIALETPPPPTSGTGPSFYWG